MVQGGLKKVQGGLEPPLAPHFPRLWCNELRGPSPWLSAWATQLRRNVAAVASRWRHCADLTGPGIEPQTYRTESVRLTTELTAIDSLNYYSPINENDKRQAE